MPGASLIRWAGNEPMTCSGDRPSRTVSVIVPTYNRASAIGAAIDSVLSQVPPPDEVIVVDDGSTDDTWTVLAGYGERIRAIRRENGGAAAARNTGLAVATGDWVAFLDSDDLWLPGRLAVLHRDLDAAAEDVVAHTGDMRMTGNGYDRILYELRGWDVPTGRAVRYDMALDRTLPGLPLPTTAVHRQAALDCGGMPENMRIFEDLAFLSNLALSGAWLFTGDLLAEARRLDCDDKALSSIARQRPHEAARVHADYLSGLLQADLSAAQRILVQRHASGALFALATIEAAENPGAARQMLIRSAQLHPSRLRGWLKALVPLVFGQRGYDLVRRRRQSRFTRA